MFSSPHSILNTSSCSPYFKHCSQPYPLYYPFFLLHTLVPLCASSHIVCFPFLMFYSLCYSLSSSSSSLHILFQCFILHTLCCIPHGPFTMFPLQFSTHTVLLYLTHHSSYCNPHPSCIIHHPSLQFYKSLTHTPYSILYTLFFITHI